MNWRKESKKVESKGLQIPKSKSLADLSQRRQATQSQYFTPDWVSRGIWSVLNQMMNAVPKRKPAIFSLLDNSIGSGRLLEGAPVESLSIYGLDPDPRCIDALNTDANNANISHQFYCGGMEDLTAANFNFAVINPPFSITLQSPNLSPFDCTHFGPFGPNSSAISHEFALEQALHAANCVVAILPVSMDTYCRQNKRLRMIVRLPRDTFNIEGASVSTAVYFFTQTAKKDVIEHSIKQSDKIWPRMPSEPDVLGPFTSPVFKLSGIDHSTPTITLPVTGDKRVELHHHNRRIVLKYHCGLTQAKVANGILVSTAKGKRLAKTIRYTGDGKLLLDVMLLQEEPEKQLLLLANKINQLGGIAVISDTLRNFYKKLVKRHKIASVPMYRAIKTTGIEALTLKAKHRMLLEPGNYNSPSLAKDAQIQAFTVEGGFKVKYGDFQTVLSHEDINTRFDTIRGDNRGGLSWAVKHKGLNHYFPEIAKHHRKRIHNKGLNNWLAPFQEDSLTEGLISPYGYIGAWEQGSGKARYALSLALLHHGNNMIALESGLLPEMLNEIKKIGLSDDAWKILKTGDSPTSKINLVTYATLRKGITVKYTKPAKGIWQREKFVKKVVRTNAEKWRRQINTLICDEGGLLANLNTQQTQAVKKLAAKKLIILDGTPQRNYPRDLLPLTAASAGHGVAHQRYGVKGKPYLTEKLSNSATESKRGEDAFFENHVVTQWVTHEFKEDLQTGAKREVPKIANLGIFREWLAPNIQRRLRAEPDLAIFNNCPKPERYELSVKWDKGHLNHYLTVATEFAEWYKNQLNNSHGNTSLVTLLARIGAVQRAANSPHVSTKSSMDLYLPLTSKQRKAIERILHWVNHGRKVILYAHSPDVLNRLKKELEKQGIEAVLFTGKQDINKRAEALNNEFRYGTSPVLLSSWVGQRGLNLEQAGTVIFYERDWSATNEEQAIYRTQRPTQRLKVVVEYLHLEGSIDVYCAQLVNWKRRAADAGLDFGEQASEDEEFIHLDTLLQRFCNDVLKMNLWDVKKELLAA